MKNMENNERHKMVLQSTRQNEGKARTIFLGFTAVGLLLFILYIGYYKYLEPPYREFPPFPPDWVYKLKFNVYLNDLKHAPEGYRRAMGAGGLARTKSPKALVPLFEAFLKDKEPRVKLSAAGAILYIYKAVRRKSWIEKFIAESVLPTLKDSQKTFPKGPKIYEGGNMQQSLILTTHRIGKCMIQKKTKDYCNHDSQ